MIDVHAVAEDRLRRLGQRYTAQRRALVSMLVSAGQPLSLPEVLQAEAGLKQSSVYRNLAALEQAGVVQRVVTDDGYGRYEPAEDLTGHHHHLVCSRCGKVRDVDLPGSLERTLDRTLDAIAGRAGFAQVSHRLDLVGMCALCAGRAQ